MRDRRRLTLAALAMLGILAGTSTARAVDAPKWVAVLHVAAQKAVGLRWMPVSGATEYKVLRSTTQGSGYAEIAATPQPQHFDKGIEPGTTYFYVLQAVAGGEVSPNSEEKSVAIPGEKKVEALGPPGLNDPTLTQATEFGKTTSKIGLTWTAPRGKVIAYNLYRSLAAGKDYQMVTSTSELQHVDVDVEVGKTYHYVVTALDDSFQETAYSVEKAVEVKAPKKVERKKRVAKIKMQLRRSKLVRTLKEGTWGMFKQPSGLAKNSDGDLFVIDGLQNMVFVFDDGGEFLFSFGQRAMKDGGLNMPLSICIDPDDDIYISMGDPRIEVYGANGSPKRTILLADLAADMEKETGTIGGLECGPDYLYVTDDKHGHIYTVDYGGKAESVVGETGKEAGQFMSPKKLWYSEAEKALVVADTYNFRIQVLRDGVADPPFGTYGNSVTQFSRVIDVAPDDQGNILAIDFGNQTTQAFGYDGKFRYVLGTANGEDQIPMAGAASIVSDGNRVWIANKLLGSVDVWDLTDEIGPPVKKKKVAKK